MHLPLRKQTGTRKKTASIHNHWLKCPKAVLISGDHVALLHMTLASTMNNLASLNLSSKNYVYFLLFSKIFNFLTKLLGLFTFWWWFFLCFWQIPFFYDFVKNIFYVFGVFIYIFGKTFFYLAKLHLRNFFWHRLSMPIHSLALPSSTLHWHLNNHLNILRLYNSKIYDIYIFYFNFFSKKSE